jgi:hypothetical protein
MTESERPPRIAGLVGRLRQARVQLALLGGLVAAIVLAILITDMVAGGDTEPAEPLGESVETAARTRVAFVPTLAPLETPPPAVIATRAPSSEADALTRDAQRLQELALLQAALAEYHDRFDEYPDNEGGIQTLCAYRELDKGCDLRKVLDEDEEYILEDPLGEALDNGYWYSSDGETYTIWMLREGPAKPSEPVCAEVVPHLRDVGSLFCLTGGGGSP